MSYPTLSEDPEERHKQIRDRLVRHIIAYFSGEGKGPEFAFNEEESLVRGNQEQIYSTWLGQVSLEGQTADLVLKIREMNPGHRKTQVVLEMGSEFETTSRRARSFISRDYPDKADRDFLARAERLIRDHTT